MPPKAPKTKKPVAVKPEPEKPARVIVPGGSIGAVSSKPSFLEQIAGQEFPGANMVYRSQPLTYKEIRRIRKDPVVKFCIAFLTIPLRKAEINYSGTTGDPDLDLQVGDYLEEVFDHIIREYLADCTNALEYGHREWEIRWEMFYSRVFKGDRVGLKTFKPIMPDFCYILEDPKTGGFRGVRVLQGGALKGQVELYTADSKVLHYCNRYDPSPVGIEGGRYGRSEFLEIQETVNKKFGNLSLLMHYMEGKGDPALIVEYDPSTALDAQNNPIDPSDEATKLGDNAKQGRTVAIPGGKIDPATGKVEKIWAMHYLESNDKVPQFKEANDLLNQEIIRGLLVPDRALTEGATGAYAQARVHADFLVLREEQILSEFLSILNSFVVPKLLAFNFAEPNVLGEITCPGLDVESEKLIEVIATAMLTNPDGLNGLTQDQREWVTESTGIPTPTDEEIEIMRAEKEAEAKAKAEEDAKAMEEKAKIAKAAGLPDPRLPVAPVVPQPAPKVVPPEKNIEHPEKVKGKEETKKLALSLDMADLSPKGKLKIGTIEPNADLSAVEAAGNFREFAGEWANLESGAWSALGYIVVLMAERYKGNLGSILATGTSAAQMKAVSALDLAYAGKFESTLKGFMLDFAKAGARSALAMHDKKVSDPELTYDVLTIVASHASMISDSQIAKLTGKVRALALGCIQREEKADRVLWDVQEGFQEYIEKDLQMSIRAWGNLMVNAGRTIIEDMVNSGQFGKDEAVAFYTRSAVLDDKVCPLCEYLNGMKIPADHPDVASFVADQHLGERCQVWAILKGEREKYAKNKPYVPPPFDLIDEYRSFTNPTVKG